MDYNVENNLISISIRDIVFQIKYKHDFNEAANIFMEKNLTFSQLIRYTVRLSLHDIAQLADLVVDNKK